MILTFITAMLFVGMAFFCGYSYARYHHHRYISEGFRYLAAIELTQSRSPSDKEVIHAFGGTKLHRTLRP